MATNKKESEAAGDVAHSEVDQQQENYKQKFQEMQKYIPFLEMMIQRLERSSDKSREAQLVKMKSLHCILSNTKKKLKIETLKRCEDVLQKLHDKVEKGTNAQAKLAAVKPTVEKITNINSQENANSGCSENASDQHIVTSSTDNDSSVSNIMKTLKLAAARTSGKNVPSATSCPSISTEQEDSRDEVHSTSTRSSMDNISSEEKTKTLDGLEQSRERLKKLMEQQTPSISIESMPQKSDGHLGSPSMEWQFQTEPPWEKETGTLSYEKGNPETVYSHSINDEIGRDVAREPNESSSRTKCVIDVGDRSQDENWDYIDSSVEERSSHEHDEPYTGWSDYKPSSRSMWPEGEHGNTVAGYGTSPNKSTISPAGLNRVPTSLHSPTNPQSFATNNIKQTIVSPTKRSLPKLPSLYNVLIHPPAVGSKPLSDADIEELLEDTSRNESEVKLGELEKKEESPHKSLRAKLEQEIQQVHRVGVSKGGALRSLVQKDDKLRSPIRNILDIMKPNSDQKKDKSPTNRMQVSSKSDCVTGGAIKVDEKEKGNDIDQSTQNTESVAVKDDNKNEFGNVKDMLSKSEVKKPTDPRRRESFSPRGEESCQNSAVGEKKDPRLRPSPNLESKFDGPSSKSCLLDKSQGTPKKDGSGLLSSLSKEELKKIVEENLRNLPSPPPNTKEILETVTMNSPTAMKPVWQQPTELISPLSSPKDYNQSGFTSPLHNSGTSGSQYGLQGESQFGIGNLPRNSASYSSTFGVPRPEERRPLLPTPNIPHDPRTLPRNLNHDPRCSRESQGPLSNMHDPRLNTSSYSHHDNYRNGILQHPSHDQFMRPVSNVYHQNSHTPFHTNQTPHLQVPARWAGTPCYGILSHNSPRPPDESFVHPGENFPHRGPNSSRFQCSPHSSQHEFSQFQGPTHPLHDQFSGSHQHHSSWQPPSSSQGSFRSGSSANFSSSIRSLGQPVQHHVNSSHSVTKVPVGDPRLSNSSAISAQFSGHRSTIASTIPPQSTTSAAAVPSLRSPGGAGTHTRAQSGEGKSGNTLSERDPRRKSIEEPEKKDCNSSSNRDNRKISSSLKSPSYRSSSERITDRHSSNERRRDSDPRKSGRRRNSPEANKMKESVLVSPLNSLYDIATVPKTGKGYGLQKFRIPKIYRPSSPPKSKSPPPLKENSPLPKLESSSGSIVDTKEKVKSAKSTTSPVTQTETQQLNLKYDSSNDIPSIDLTDEKCKVDSVISGNHESTEPEKSYVMESEKTSLESRSKDEVTQEWIEALIRKSFESGEGKKFIEQAKLYEKLGENLKGKKLRKIKRILESDSDSGSDDSPLVPSKKKEEHVYPEKEDQKIEEKGKPLKDKMSVEQNKRSKCRRVILSDDESTDSENLASKLKGKEEEEDNPLSVMKSKDRKDDESNKVEEVALGENKQYNSRDEAKPVKKYSKRRSALELLQEDIRDMFICEGVVTATGHRMCRLLKETPPGMTVDEISKSKRIEDEVTSTAEESDGSSIIGKRQLRKLVKKNKLDKKGKEEKLDKKQKVKVRMKDEEIECGSEKGFSDVPNEMDEIITNRKTGKIDDSSLIDETGDSSGSPVRKPRKKYGKSKWKGYVIEESDDSVEEIAVDKADNKKKDAGEIKEAEGNDKPLEQSNSKHIKTRSKLNLSNEGADESETSNSERGRRTRFPRVILEKADISKLSLVSSKPRRRYFEDSSSDEESVMEDTSSTPMSSLKSKFKAAQKSKAKTKHSYLKRGRRGVSRRGRKKHSKVDRNDEFSTDGESIVSDISSITSSVPQQTNLVSPFAPIGFTFRRKCNSKRSKFLGKKIDDIINRLTKDVGGFKNTDSNSEEKLSESGRVDSSAVDLVAEPTNDKLKEKETIVETEDISKPSFSTTRNVDIAKIDGDTEGIRAPCVAKKRNSRIMLNLVRKSAVQKNIKKKKSRWQLGIINQTKKKSCIKFKSEVEIKDAIGSISCENKAKGQKEVNELNKAVSADHADEGNCTEKDGSDTMSVNESKEELVSRKQNFAESINDEVNKKDKITQIGESEVKNMTSAICAKKSLNEKITFLDSETYGAKRDSTQIVIDRNYVLSGRYKYACKLCPTHCKSIVSHYKNNHPDSEVLISRLPEEEATRAVAEALKNNYKDEGCTKKGPRKRKQAGRFVCRICDHVATFAPNFYEHVSSHTGEYRFQCGKCPYEACTRHSVKAHFYNHHSELKGIESISATILASGPPNDAKFVFGYLCSSCNYVQLLKQNIEKHISLWHPSETNAKLIYINMSKISKTPEDVEPKELCSNVNTNEVKGYVADEVSFSVENSNDVEESNVKSLESETKIIPEENIKKLDSIVTEMNLIEQKPEAQGMYSKSFEAPAEGNMKKEQTSEIELVGSVSETRAENSIDSYCTLISENPNDSSVVNAVGKKPDAIFQELSRVNSSDLDLEDGGIKSSNCPAKEDLKDAEEAQWKQKIEHAGKNDGGNTNTTIISESSTSASEESGKEVDLKAFVCSDDLEEENDVIQKERLKKMEEIARNLKDNHPKLLKSNRSSILDQLSDKLKTGFKSKTVDNTIREINDEAMDTLTHNEDSDQESESKENESRAEKIADETTLIDEKRAIEAAQAVQNLLRAERETIGDKQSTGIVQKTVESPTGTKSGRPSKSGTGDTIERRITRSFSRNEDDIDVETVDESSSDISYDFEVEDNEEIPESQSQSPKTLLNETLTALKDVSPRKSSSRMFNIIERLASKVVPKTEPLDMNDQPVEMDIPEPSSSIIASEDNVFHSTPNESSKDSKLETNETGAMKSVVNKKSSSVIGKPPPLISLGDRDKNMLRDISGIGSEGSVSSVRVGPLEVRRFSEGLLYSCYVRGCIFASTSRLLFASHIENTHKVSRWDGSCKTCNSQVKDQHLLYKLSHALHHLIKFHLVASPNDPTTSNTVSGDQHDISTLSMENTSIGGLEMLIEKTSIGGEMSTEKTFIAGEEVSTEKTSVGGGDNSNSNEGAPEASAPRKFIRLRRLSGDLLSVPKPAEDAVSIDAQQLVLRQDDIEVNHLINEPPGEEASNNEEDSGPFLRIESVVSLNPEAMGTEDVHEILKAVEDPQNTSKSPEKSDSAGSNNVSLLTTSNISPPTNIYSISGSSCVSSPTAAIASTVIESSMPFMAGSSTSVLRTSSDVQFLPSSSSLPVSVLRGKGSRPHGTMRMIPINPLQKPSTITILPSLQQLSPMKLSNMQLSPVKLTSLKPSDIASKPGVSTNIPHSLVGLSQITRPTGSKVTVAKERLSTGMIGGGMWCNQVLPNILPKGTFVRVEIKDNQVTTKTPMMLTTKSQSPLMVNMKTTPSLTSSIVKAPISSTLVQKELEVEILATKMPPKGKSPPNLAPPPVPVTPASNMVLSTVVPKTKLPHKSAVAPSYAKASKVPKMYQEMIKPTKLRHLYKCMARLCSYTTDSTENYAKHYNEHENQMGQRSTEKKKGRPPVVKMSDWQQCAYCCALQTSLESVLEHVQTEHGHCLYQCAYCFYRAVTKSYIVLHQNTSHTNEHVAVLMCKEVKNLPNQVDMAKPRSSVIVPYICEQGNCGATFYISECFVRHLEKEHAQLAIYSCHICGSQSFKPDRLLAHYKLHSCCFYQCMYCLHGTDTKEEMHHHLCNFHSNQTAKVIIRASNTSEIAALNGKQSGQDLLNALRVLDLDEGLLDEGLLILPPPEVEPAPEDPILSASNSFCTGSESGDSSTNSGPLDGNLSGNIGMKRVVDDEIMNAVSSISSESKSLPAELLVTNSERKGSKGLAEETPNSVGDDKSEKSNPSASGNYDDIVIIDDDHDIPHKSQQDSDLKDSQTDSDIMCSEKESNIDSLRPSQLDSDVECLGEPGNLNETHDPDVIVLDNTNETVSTNQDTEAVDKDLTHDRTGKVNDLILHEPMVTVKHRNPKTSAAIEAAVDPLSLELSQSPLDTQYLPQNENDDVSNEVTKTPNVTLPTQSTYRTSDVLAPAKVPGSDFEIGSTNADSTVSSIESKSEAFQNEADAGGVEDIEDTGLSGSKLYRCGYVTCTFSAEDSSLLKDHLLVCDLARASSSLTCIHCKKQFKHVSSLLEHLRTHGTRRFGCALCSFRAPVPQQVAKHLKQRHRVGSTRVVPLNPLRTDAETAMFVVFPKEKGKGGRGGRGNGKDTHDVRKKLLFLPEEVELLPRQAIYTRPVRCVTCSYTTKVRSNMVRHLHLHMTSSIVPDVVPPNNAPVNPVPCLEKKEMMFDKMTNLAASSHIATGAKASETPSGSLTLTEELEEKLPKFVPEHQRYVCGAPECSYLTCDEIMLRYHLRALHFDETAYRCPHCPESAQQENAGQIVSVERMGTHLKMHDNRLYKCAHCMYHHFQRYVVERHLADKHPEKRPFVHVVREPEVESGIVKAEAVASTSVEGAGSPSTAAPVKNPWHCGLCKFRCATRSEVLDHTWGVHGLKSQFKCGLCSYRSSSKASFDSHFASKHPAAGNVELVHVYRKVDCPRTPQSPVGKSGSSLDISLFDTTPLWRRDMQRVRHIRGILLEEEGDVPKPDIVRRTSVDVEEIEEKEGKFGPYGKPIAGNFYFCTICNKYRTKFKADFRDHLYRELKYHKWVCTHCSLMSCNRNSLQKHSAKIHERDRKPEAIAPLTPNKEIEEWVEKVIYTQLTMMKIDQQTTSTEASSSSNKTSGPGLVNLSQPGPSGLAGRSSKIGTSEHSITGTGFAKASGVKASVMEKEDVIVIGSTSSDSDSGTSKKKMPVARDLADSMKISSSALAAPTSSKEIGLEDETDNDGSPYSKMKVGTPGAMRVLRFPCKHCNMKFALVRGLKLHIRHNHLKLSIWTCGHCGYVANSEESVLNHNKVDHPDLPSKCSPHTKGSCVKLDDEFWQREYGLGQGSESKYPDTPSTTPSSSTSHSPLGSPIKKRQRTSSSPDESEGNSSSSLLLSVDQSFNKCLYCDYFCRSASDLKYHMMRHWVQKPYKCGYCEFEGVREYEIKKHSAKIHPLKKLRVIEKPMPSQPDIRPLQRNKRSKPDFLGPRSDALASEIGNEKVTQSDDAEDVNEDVVDTKDEKAEEGQQKTTAVPNIFRCFYCPQRGTSVVSIHQHWQEKHKNKLIGPNGVLRHGLPFKYKEVNMKQFLKGQDGSAGRRPAFQCSYCKVRGTLAVLEAHQKTVHPDKAFQVSQASFTHYECAECHFAAFTVNTLKRHFDMEHQGKELRYLVSSTKENSSSVLKSKDSNKSAASLGLSAPTTIITAKYMCLWCEETCESEDKIQVHHAMCHSHLQLKYSVEKSSTSTAQCSDVHPKKFSCPSCTFTSDSRQSMSEHLHYHVKPYKCGYCPRTFEFPSKVHSHALLAHPELECKVIQLEDAEKELAKLRRETGINESVQDFRSGMKRDSEAYDVSPSHKRLCVARKSTTLSPRVGKFHAVARKSTNPLPSQTAKKVSSATYDVEQGDTSAPSSRSESPAACSEFSYYGCRPDVVDKNRITASVKLRNNLGVNMNMSLATMERFTNMYPVVKVKDLKYEKWGFL